MHSEFIQYLKSMNNASSNNDNAIAESQITSPFYEEIRVERNIGNYLLEVIEKKPSMIILTGHAGDGKTSLLHQILRKLNVIQAGEKLKVSDTCSPLSWQGDLFYVKDMSELPVNQQVEYLKKGLDVKHEGGSSIIVSNTGPIIDAFKELERRIYSKENQEVIDSKIISVEMELLKMLDENLGESNYIGDHEVIIINLARIDNTDIIPLLIDKLLDDELWKQEIHCSKGRYCPIYNNYLCLKDNIEEVKKTIQAFYRWLYENDKRLTIRQILAHLTFAITGNLDCSKVTKINEKSLLFNYHFSNLFFGFVGFEPFADALKIRAIKEIQQLKLDEKSLPFDYDMFVRESFDNLTDPVRELTTDVWFNTMKKRVWDTNSLLNEDEPYLIRKSLKRFEILFSNYNGEQYTLLLSSLFSPVYPHFLKYRSKELKRKELRPVKVDIMKALNIMLIGSVHDSSANEPLYLPLKREGFGQQNVYLLIGKIDESDLVVHQVERISKYDLTHSYYELELEFKAIEERFPLSLLLLDYFDHLSRGSLSTKLNPALSHGVDKMKSKLYKNYRFEDENVMKILIRTLHGVKVVDLEFDENGEELYFG